MENNTEETRDEKKRMPLIPILAVLSVLAIGFWFGLGQDTKTPSLANGEENHTEDDGHGHEAGDVQEKEGHEEGEDAHGEHGEEEAIKLSEAEMKEFGIKVVKADAGTLSRYADLPGEVRANGDRLAHIVPRVPGVVRKVFKGLGDRVKKGEVMAILDSRELSDSKANFLWRKSTLHGKNRFGRKKSLQSRNTSKRNRSWPKQTLNAVPQSKNCMPWVFQIAISKTSRVTLKSRLRNTKLPLHFLEPSLKNTSRSVRS